jgi:hypothetical protein
VKKKVVTAGSAIDGHMRNRLNSGMKKDIIPEESNDGEKIEGEECVCKNLCKRKYF